MEWVTRLEIVPPQYFPYASTIAARIPGLLVDHAFLADVAATFLVWLEALAVTVLIAVPLGIALGTSDLAFRVVSPIVNLMRPIPSVALLPLAIVVFGVGLQMKILLVCYAMAWPILVNTIYGVHDLDPVAIQTARSFGLGRLAIIRRVSIPSAAPFIFTGVRISASIGLVVLVSAELLSDSTSGIGSYIMRNSAGGAHMDRILAAAAIAALLGLLLNGILAAIDRWRFTWRYARDEAP
jgi:NitT/TauT family transport system permease protein